MKKKDFQNIIYSFYKDNKRDFPFRNTADPYKVLVSEIMLQQTQTSRVTPKYEAFIKEFPDFQSLMNAELGPLLTIWKGLGYNRRAKALREIAGIVITEYGGKLPKEPQTLERFPSIGPATAASIAAFAYNIATVFIEVNIRRVFIYFFFSNRIDVSDKEIRPLVDETLDRENPREWYYALMDYGVMLKSCCPGLAKQSKHYVKQKPFEGSIRQLRGKILHHAAGNSRFSIQELSISFECAEQRVEKTVAQLTAEGFLRKKGEIYTISD